MKRTRWALTLATFALHLAVAGRYDFFRDELYFIACGRRPAFGYADQPPIIPLLAAASQLFGEHLWLLRAVAAVGAAGAVWFVCLIAEELGGGVLLAGLAAATAPIYLGLTSTLGTSTFEPMLWAALVYCVLRGEWIWVGVIAGLDLEVKYELPVRLVPLLVALAVTGRGRELLQRKVIIGALIALVLGAPSLVWQVAHGLPFRDLVHAAAEKNRSVGPGEFLLQQVLVVNPIWVLVALSGIWIPFSERRFRFLPVSFLLTAVAVIALHGKDYYLAPSWAPMFALGASRLGKLRPAWLIAPGVAYSALVAPVAMPILDVPHLAVWSQALGVTKHAAEKLDQSDLPQTFADELGWRALAEVTTRAVSRLPPADRDRAVILGRNYGESAALEFFAPQLRVIGRHNQYWYWGPRGDGAVLILINWSPREIAGKCDRIELLDRVQAPHVMPFEEGAEVTLCKGLHTPLPQLWPELRLML